MSEEWNPNSLWGRWDYETLLKLCAAEAVGGEVRPWGRFEIIESGDGWTHKRIWVNPHSRISLQKHEGRDEQWFGVLGVGEAILGHSVRYLAPGTILLIPRGCVHRVSNLRKDTLVFLERQRGVSSESDIVRLADDYGRCS